MRAHSPYKRDDILHTRPIILRSLLILDAKKALLMRAHSQKALLMERWGAGVDTQKNIRGEIGGWGRVPFNEPYAPS